jgi:hypothetical protein
MRLMRTGYSPEEHHHAESLGSIFLEDDLQRNARDEIPKVKDPDANVEALAEEVEFLLHACDFCVSNVGPVGTCQLTGT